MVKQSLRKGIGYKLFYWDKLLTLLAEIEAIINTQPLTYVCDDFESGLVLTPIHFVTGNLDVIPFMQMSLWMVRIEIIIPEWIQQRNIGEKVKDN